MAQIGKAFGENAIGGRNVGLNDITLAADGAPGQPKAAGFPLNGNDVKHGRRIRRIGAGAEFVEAGRTVACEPCVEAG